MPTIGWWACSCGIFYPNDFQPEQPDFILCLLFFWASENAFGMCHTLSKSLISSITSPPSWIIMLTSTVSPERLSQPCSFRDVGYHSHYFPSSSTLCLFLSPSHLNLSPAQRGSGAIRTPSGRQPSQDGAVSCSLMEGRRHAEHSVLFIRGSEKENRAPTWPACWETPEHAEQPPEGTTYQLKSKSFFERIFY